MKKEERQKLTYAYIQNELLKNGKILMLYNAKMYEYKE